VIVISIKYPFYNWDIIGYVGSVLSIDIKDNIALHATSYKVLNNQMPEPSFDRLIIGNYAQNVYSNHNVFVEQLNFYQIKTLYIYLLYTLQLTGLTIIDSITLVSLSATLLATGITLLWINRYTNPHIAFILTLLICFQSRLFDLSRIATPDALSVSIILLGLYYLLEKKKIKSACIIISISTLVRPDNIIFASLFFLLVAGISYSKEKKQNFIFSVSILSLSILSYFYFKSINNGYSWWTLFYHSFIEKLYFPSQLDIGFSLPLYAEVLRKQAGMLFAPGISSPSTILVFIFMLIVAALSSQKNGARESAKYYKGVWVIIGTTYLTYFLLFPGIDQWDRFFAGYYIFTVISLLSVSDLVIGCLKNNT